MPTTCSVPRVIPDLDDELTSALLELEEALISLAFSEEDDGLHLPGLLAGRRALELVRRVWDAVAPTQSWSGHSIGPRWFAPDGRYEHRPLRLVTLADADADELCYLVALLGRFVGLEDGVRQVIEEHGGVRLVENAKRLGELIAVGAQVGRTSLAGWCAASTGCSAVVLDQEGEADFQRAVGRLDHAWTGGSALDWFLY